MIMMISTKGRYAMRVMIDIAEHNDGHYISLKTIAERQNISFKYLERIMVVLSKADYIDAHHGKGGGYKLNRDPSEYTVADILNLTESSMAPVACLKAGENACKNASECKTLPLWTNLNALIHDYLNHITLEDLVNGTALDTLDF